MYGEVWRPALEGGDEALAVASGIEVNERRHLLVDHDREVEVRRAGLLLHLGDTLLRHRFRLRGRLLADVAVLNLFRQPDQLIEHVVRVGPRRRELAREVGRLQQSLVDRSFTIVKLLHFALDDRILGGREQSGNLGARIPRLLSVDAFPAVG